mgnify:FL=1
MNSKTNKQKILSPYFPYVNAKKGKSFLVSFAEFSLTFILTFILFVAIGYPSFFSTSYALDANNEIASKQKQLNEIVLSTGLGTLGKDGSISDGKDMAKSYIESLVKTNCFLLNNKYRVNSNDGTGQVKEVSVNKEDTLLILTKEKNPLAYYFLSFKEEKEPLNSYIYDDVDVSSYKEDYLYKNIYGYDSSRFEVIDNNYSIYLQIKKSEAVTLNDYLLYKKDDDKSSYEYYEDAFLKARQFLIEEVENKYPPYVEINSSFMENYKVLVKGTIIAISICYFLSFSILEIIIPSLTKRNISSIMMRSGYCQEDGGVVSFKNYLLRGLYDIFGYFAPTFLILYFMGLSSFAFFDLGLGITFFYVCVMSLVFDLASFLFIMFSPSSRGLGEKLARMEVKDLNMMEAGEAKSDKEINDERKSN